MLTVTKVPSLNAPTYRFSGTIDETTNFTQLLGPLPPKLHLYCKEVSRINSSGMRAWMLYFLNVRITKTELEFYECSTAIVEQMNNFRNFSCNGKVESIYVPFACEACHSELIGLFKTDELRKMNFEIPDQACAKCGGKSVFDDIPEQYFAFLKR